MSGESGPGIQENSDNNGNHGKRNKIHIEQMMLYHDERKYREWDDDDE